MTDFVRLVGTTAIADYERCITFEEKLNSGLIRSMRKYSGVSVFRLSGITVERVVAAVTALRRNVGSASYARFGEFVVLPERVLGSTPDAGVNAQHHEFCNMSDTDLVYLADHMTGGESGSMSSDQILYECRRSVDAGHMSASDVRYDLGEGQCADGDLNQTVIGMTV